MTTRKIYCPASKDNWVCTLEDGHTGFHEAAGTGGYAWWPQTFPAPKDHPATKHLFDPEFFKYKPEEKQHNVQLTLEELKSVAYALAGEEWLEDEPELVKKFDKALKAAL